MLLKGFSLLLMWVLLASGCLAGWLKPEASGPTYSLMEIDPLWTNAAPNYLRVNGWIQSSLVTNSAAGGMYLTSPRLSWLIWSDAMPGVITQILLTAREWDEGEGEAMHQHFGFDFGGHDIRNALYFGDGAGLTNISASPSGSATNALLLLDKTWGEATTNDLTNVNWSALGSGMDPATASNSFVKLAGDTMTGPLTNNSTIWSAGGEPDLSGGLYLFDPDAGDWWSIVGESTRLRFRSHPASQSWLVFDRESTNALFLGSVQAANFVGSGAGLTNLSGAISPAAASNAFTVLPGANVMVEVTATGRIVNASAPGIAAAIASNSFVSKAGDTMTGALSNSDGRIWLGGDGQSGDLHLWDVTEEAWRTVNSYDHELFFAGTPVILEGDDCTTNYVKRTGGTMTGPLTNTNGRVWLGSVDKAGELYLYSPGEASWGLVGLIDAGLAFNDNMVLIDSADCNTNYVKRTGGAMSGALTTTAVYADWLISTGNQVRITSAGAGSVRIGYNATVTDAGFNNNVCIGNSAQTYGDSGSIAIGKGANARAGSVVIGTDADIFAGDATVVGAGAEHTSGGGVAVGRSANALGYYTTALGYLANANGSYAVAVGGYYTYAGLYGVAVGGNANAHDESVIVGCFGQAYRSGTAYGYATKAFQTNIAIGYLAVSTQGTDRVSIGNRTTNDIADGTAVIRGSLYLNGGDGLHARDSANAGAYSNSIVFDPAHTQIIFTCAGIVWTNKP